MIPRNAHALARPRIGISYRYRDSGDRVSALFEQLRAHFGTDRVKDMHAFAHGPDLRKTLEKELESCAVLLVLIGPNFLTYQNSESHERGVNDAADPFRLEIATALRSEHVTVIPILIGPATMPSAQETFHQTSPSLPIAMQ